MIRAVLPHAEGRTRRHERRVRDAVPLIMSDALSAQTTGMMADVKSQRPDTPKLVSPRNARQRVVAEWWPTSRRARETAYKREDTAQGMPDARLNLWYLPPAFLFAGGPWVRPSPGIPCTLSFAERVN
ncbi:protein of unknown function [Bradyrhizobium sp. ORS 285]|uniref:hypothetical protein n=1 Tax=Bradyrhizobium sp. ORS 285 TaxID=115808 RepID=UPI0002409FC8|nr:hypothetical protein [Bradyrhizobium sp. ORS 285]CCD85218.1 hypothetical protein BRAO285_1350072 [Bradyrhizobium sp. ORS 285]SMX58143.1 protein of unknown function [Bradyrhizobium sp. ORS 285]